jgi:hypothetical protein
MQTWFEVNVENDETRCKLVLSHFEQTDPIFSFSDARERAEAQPKAEVTFPERIAL